MCINQVSFIFSENVLGLLDGLVRARFTRRPVRVHVSATRLHLIRISSYWFASCYYWTHLSWSNLSLKIITPTYSTIEGVFTRNQIVYSRSGEVSAPASNQSTGRNVFDRFSKFLPRFSFLRSWNRDNFITI